MALVWAQTAFRKALALLGTNPPTVEQQVLRQICIGLGHMAKDLERLDKRLR